MTRRLSLAALLAVALLPAAARAAETQRPEAGAAEAPPLSKEDAQLLWEEAVRTSSGLKYTFVVYAFQAEEEARSSCAKYPRCKAARSKAKQTLFLPELPMAFREQLVRLSEGELSQPLAAPGGAGWLVFEARGAAAGDFVKATANPWEWLRKYAATCLPSPSALRTEPELKARSALNRVRNAGDLARALEERSVTPAQLDLKLSNGLTSLLLAVYRNDLPLLTALLEAGASPDACGYVDCPLSAAVSLGQPEAAKALLAHKARPDGLPEEHHTPLMQAAARGDRALAQALLDAGADPLQSRTVVIGVPWLRSTLFYAGGKHPEFLAWFEPIFRGALERTGKYGWEGWVEQDGKRTPIADKATLTLQPKPFRVVFKTREGVPFRAAASDSAEFVAATDSVAVRQSILSPMKLAAMDADDKYLVVWKLKGGVPADGMVDAGSTEWSHGADAKKATGTVLRQTKAGAEYVHEVAELSVEGTSVPLAGYTGAPIQLLLGTFPPYGDGTDFFEPRRVTLQFGRK